MESDILPYWTDPLIPEFRVTVLDCQPVGKAFEVRIRENVIRPEGGGQAGDRGELRIGKKSVPFTDTVMREQGIAVVTQEPVSGRTEAALVVNMDWRRAMMRNHSAEHLFVGTLRKHKPQLQPGYIWIDGKHGIVELTGASVAVEDILRAESEVQHLVALDIPVTTEIVDSSRLDASVRVREGVTSKHDRLRIVKIGESDSSACSGTHVLKSGDIGLFKVVDYKLTDSSVRLEFVAGEPASELVSSVFNAALTRKYEYPYEFDQLGAVLDKSKTAWNERNELLDTVERLVVERPVVEVAGKIAFVHEYLPAFDTNRMKRLVKKMHMTGASIVLLMSPGEKSNFIVVTNDINDSAESIVGDLIRQMGGKGGGSNDVYTGGFLGVRNPLELYDRLVIGLKQRLGTL
ncbi:MAG: hypothetical protein C4K47_05455 [Candidatus Thorarchaeota archaeon]|nr:MAG: hypothetical protein C4K47_05455 [Candidatus Thorarchaeota archaeon]